MEYLEGGASTTGNGAVEGCGMRSQVTHHHRRSSLFLSPLLSLLFDSRDACAAGGIPVTIPPACLARSAGAHTHAIDLLFTYFYLLCSLLLSSLLCLENSNPKAPVPSPGAGSPRGGGTFRSSVAPWLSSASTGSFLFFFLFTQLAS